MNPAEYLQFLANDLARLREVAALDLTADVPTCPGWTVTDLVRHVGVVYLHKAECMRQGVEPADWPPAGIDDEPVLALLDRAYAVLLDEFDRHEPSDPSGTWFTPDPTVGFWYRRMAQETVVHRIDAELATGQSIVPVPDDLATDGVDEQLGLFLPFTVAEWGSYFSDVLDASPGFTTVVSTGDRSWTVTTAPHTFTVVGGPSERRDATISGAPQAMLMWAWGRNVGDASSPITTEGLDEAVEQIRRCLAITSQ